VGEKTVRRAGEFAEVVITVPSVPTVPPLAPNRPPADNGVKLTPLSGSHATARQLGDLRQVLQREPKCAPHASRYPPKKRKNFPLFRPPQSLYIVRYDGNPKTTARRELSVHPSVKMQRTARRPRIYPIALSRYTVASRWRIARMRMASFASKTAVFSPTPCNNTTDREAHYPPEKEDNLTSFSAATPIPLAILGWR
jgi:hypothetical protein